MNTKPKWNQCRAMFFTSKKFLQQYMSKDLYQYCEKYMKSDAFSTEITFKLKGVLNEDKSIEVVKEYNFDERFSRLFYNKNAKNVSIEQAQHRGEIIDNILNLLYFKNTFEFSFVKDILFDNFSKKNGINSLEQVNYQIDKVFELIQLKEIIDNPKKSNITISVKANYSAFGDSHDVREYFFDKEILSIEKIEEVFHRKYNTWDQNTTQFILSNDYGYSIAAPNRELKEEDIKLGDSYAFTSSVLLHYQQNGMLYPKPTLESLKAVYALLSAYRGKDNRKNKYYKYLGTLVFSIRSYLLEKWQNLNPNKKINKTKLSELIVNFILLFDFIPEDHRLINLIEDKKCRKFIDDLIKNMN